MYSSVLVALRTKYFFCNLHEISSAEDSAFIVIIMYLVLAIALFLNMINSIYLILAKRLDIFYLNE